MKYQKTFFFLFKNSGNWCKCALTRWFFRFCSQLHPHKSGVTLLNEILPTNLYLRHLSLERPVSHPLTIKARNLENYLKSRFFFFLPKSLNSRSWILCYPLCSIHFLSFFQILHKRVHFLVENSDPLVLETVLPCRIQITWRLCHLLSPFKFLSVADNFYEEDDNYILGSGVSPPGYLPKPTKEPAGSNKHKYYCSGKGWR